MSDESRLNRHQAIVGAFFEDVLASRDMRAITPEDWHEILSFEALPARFLEALTYQLYERPYLAFPDPIFGITTRPGHLFDDVFWDVFHAYPLHICHVTRLDEGAQLDPRRVHDIRFRVDEKRTVMEHTVPTQGEKEEK